MYVGIVPNDIAILHVNVRADVVREDIVRVDVVCANVERANVVRANVVRADIMLTDLYPRKSLVTTRPGMIT